MEVEAEAGLELVELVELVEADKEVQEVVIMKELELLIKVVEAVAVAKMELVKLEGQVLLCLRYLIDFRQYFQVVLQVL